MRVLLVLLVLLTLVLWRANGHKTESEARPTSTPLALPRWTLTTDPTPAEFVIGESHFVFQKSYVSYAEDRSGGRKEELFLRALLPQIEPSMESNLDQFSRPGWGNKITLALTDARRLRDPAELKAWWFSLIQPRSVTRTEHGLVRFNLRDIFANDNLYVPVSPHPDIEYFHCDIKDKVLISPACEFDFYYDKDIHVNYAYSKDYLPRWREVHERVRRFIAEHSE